MEHIQSYIMITKKEPQWDHNMMEADFFCNNKLYDRIWSFLVYIMLHKLTRTRLCIQNMMCSNPNIYMSIWYELACPVFDFQKWKCNYAFKDHHNNSVCINLIKQMTYVTRKIRKWLISGGKMLQHVKISCFPFSAYM